MNSRIDDLVTLLNRGISQRIIYFADHPKVHACAHDLAQRLVQEIAAQEGDSFFLGVADGRLVYEGRLLLGASIIGRKIAAFLGRLGSGGLLFRRGVDAGQLIRLFGIAAEQGEPLAGGLEAARRLFAGQGLRAIELSPPYEDGDWFGRRSKLDLAELGESEREGSLAAMIPIYQSLFETVETAHSKAVGDHALDIDGARSASERFLSASGGRFTDMMQLVRYPDFDSYTVGHSVRVAMLCVLVGQSLELRDDRLMEIGTAGLLHDVGKAKVPDEILFKAGRLDPDELRIMRIHPEAGAEILLESGHADPEVIAAAWGHHMRHDLRGYPEVPGWMAQGQTTALLQVCDVFEALTAVRPYKPATTPLRAYEIMFADRGAFHPGALRALVRALGLYPPGSRVELSDDSHAVVLAAGAAVDRPVLRKVDGAALQGDDVIELDLAAAEHAGLSIRRLLSPDEDETDATELAAMGEDIEG